eukprot:352836-Chlamydomonas_euryale.AAC.4
MAFRYLSAVPGLSSALQYISINRWLMNGGGEQQVVVTSPRAGVVAHVMLLVDAAAYMQQAVADGRTHMDVALEQVGTMLRGVLLPTDRVTLAFFDTTFHYVWRDREVGSILQHPDSLRRLRDEPVRMYQTQGDAIRTLLWDRTLQALLSMRTNAGGKQTDVEGNKVLNLLVVFTDKLDSASTAKLNNTVKSVSTNGPPNFNFRLVTASNTPAENVGCLKTLHKGTCESRQVMAARDTTPSPDTLKAVC